MLCYEYDTIYYTKYKPFININHVLRMTDDRCFA